MVKVERVPDREIPDEIARMERIEKLSQWLDDAFVVPGTNFRIGWDTIIGFVPIAGDTVTTIMSGYLINEARRLGVSRWTLFRMITNVGIDYILGAVPFVGDLLFDPFFKANRKNVKLLRKALAKRSTSHVQPDGVEVEVLDGTSSRATTSS